MYIYINICIYLYKYINLYINFFFGENPNLGSKKSLIYFLMKYIGGKRNLDLPRTSINE